MLRKLRLPALALGAALALLSPAGAVARDRDHARGVSPHELRERNERHYRGGGFYYGPPYRYYYYNPWYDPFYNPYYDPWGWPYR
jgi:hypothetical protein